MHLLNKLTLAAIGLACLCGNAAAQDARAAIAGAEKAIVATYTGWKDFGGAMAPSRIVQTRGGGLSLRPM